MIPKVIHYCWFGGNPLPPLAVKCIKSWRMVCPDYEIIEWNERNFNVELNRYTREAYASKKWAFVSDVARLHILYNHGGIYMDTDVELKKPMDVFLENQGFSGFESPEYVQTGVMGCERQYGLFKEFLDYYKDKKFINEDGSLDTTTNVAIITGVVSNYGLIKDNSMQTIKGFKLYPNDYFCPKDFSTGKITITPNTVAVHHFNASWFTDEQREVLRKNRLYKRFFGAWLGGKIGNAMYVYKTSGSRGVIRKMKGKS